MRGVKKRISTPGLPSLNYTCSFEAEKVVEELKGYQNIRVSFVNEGAMTAAFPRYIREHVTGVTFVDMTDEIDEIKAIKSPEEVECIKYSAYLHDESDEGLFRGHQARGQKSLRWLPWED